MSELSAIIAGIKDCIHNKPSGTIELGANIARNLLYALEQIESENKVLQDRLKAAMKITDIVKINYNTVTEQAKPTIEYLQAELAEKDRKLAEVESELKRMIGRSAFKAGYSYAQKELQSLITQAEQRGIKQGEYNKQLEYSQVGFCSATNR